MKIAQNSWAPKAFGDPWGSVGHTSGSSALWCGLGRLPPSDLCFLCSALCSQGASLSRETLFLPPSSAVLFQVCVPNPGASSSPT